MQLPAGFEQRCHFYKSFATIPPKSIMTKRKKYDFSQITMRKHKTFGKIEERVVSIDILLNGEIKGN